MKRTVGDCVAVPAGAGEAGAVLSAEARRPLRELMDDRLLDALERSRDSAGGLRLTGEGSMLGELATAMTWVTYWCTSDGRIVLLTVFRKTRQHEQRQIDRAVRAQKTCEREHRPVTETYERQV